MYILVYIQSICWWNPTYFSALFCRLIYFLHDDPLHLHSVLIRYNSGSDEIESYYEAERGEYFFDRNRAVFQPILGYYLSNGVMCLPSHINPDIFVEELRFFKMGPHVISRFAIQQASSQWLITQGNRFCHPLQKKLWMVSLSNNIVNVLWSLNYIFSNSDLTWVLWVR